MLYDVLITDFTYQDQGNAAGCALGSFDLFAARLDKPTLSVQATVDLATSLSSGDITSNTYSQSGVSISLTGGGLGNLLQIGVTNGCTLQGLGSFTILLTYYKVY